MFLTRLKLATAMLFLVGVASAGIGGLCHATRPTLRAEYLEEAPPRKEKPPADDPKVKQLLAELEVARANLQQANATVARARKQFLAARERYDTARRKGQPVKPRTVTGVLRKLDAGRGSVSVEMRVETEVRDADLLGLPFSAYISRVFETFQVGKDAVIVQDNSKAKLADLKVGSHITLTLKDKTTTRVVTDGDTVEARFVSANTARNTIAVTAGPKGERSVYHLVKETEVLTDRGKAGRITDLTEGAMLLLTRSVEDVNTVIRIEPMPAKKGKEE